MTGEVGKLYANALFEISLENNDADNIYNDLLQCNEIFSQNPDLVKLLSSPVILKSDKMDIITKIFGESGTVRDFICVVMERNRISCFDSITKAYSQSYNQYRNIAEMTVITSVPLKDEKRAKLIKKLEEKSGKTVKLVEKVAPSIIGGIILKYGNSQIDNSIRGRLEAVSKQLKIQ